MTPDVHGALWVNDLQRLPPVHVPTGYAFAEVGEGSPAAYFVAAACKNEAGADLTLAAYEQRLGEGHRVFAAWQRPSGDLAGFCWATTADVYAPPIESMLHFAPDECYGFEAFVSDAHRGRHLFALLLVYAGQAFAKEGRRYMWGGIKDENKASQASCIGAGFQPILKLRYQPETHRLRPRPVEYAPHRLVERARATLAGHVQVAIAS